MNCQARICVKPGGVLRELLCLTECTHGRSGQEKPSAYQRDDLWVLSPEPSFQGAALPSGLKGRSPQGWVVVARSLWHGPNKDGRQAPAPHTSLAKELLVGDLSLQSLAVNAPHA